MIPVTFEYGGDAAGYAIPTVLRWAPAVPRVGEHVTLSIKVGEQNIMVSGVVLKVVWDERGSDGSLRPLVRFGR